VKDGAVIKWDTVLLGVRDGAGPVFGAIGKADEVLDSDRGYLRKQRAVQITGFESGWPKDTQQFETALRWAWCDVESRSFLQRRSNQSSSLCSESKAPPCGGAMSRVFWANQQS
jgi:hypothetical protein